MNLKILPAFLGPTPVINLINVLILPTRYDFTRVLAIQPHMGFPAGFSPPLPSITLAMLSTSRRKRRTNHSQRRLLHSRQLIFLPLRSWLESQLSSHSATPLLLRRSCYRRLGGPGGEVHWRRSRCWTLALCANIDVVRVCILGDS